MCQVEERWQELGCWVSRKRKAEKNWILGFKQKKAGKKLDFVFEPKEKWHEIGCWVSSKR